MRQPCAIVSGSSGHCTLRIAPCPAGLQVRSCRLHCDLLTASRLLPLVGNDVTVRRGASVKSRVDPRWSQTHSWVRSSTGQSIRLLIGGLRVRVLPGSPFISRRCGRSSGVEHLLAKQDVVGSNPIARSNSCGAAAPPGALSSSGRAPVLQAGGGRFESDRVHQQDPRAGE